MSDCMHDRTSKTWWDSIVFKPKLQTYAKFKQSFKTEDQVLGYMSRYQRSLLYNSERGLSHCILNR